MAIALVMSGVPTWAFAESSGEDQAQGIVAMIEDADEVEPLLQASATSYVARGKLGTCAWEIKSNGALVIGGGVLPSNDQGDVEFWPWSQYNDAVTSVVFSKSVALAGSAAYLFYNLPNAKTVDASKFDASGITDMAYMFAYCESLEEIDLSMFNTSSVWDMSSMFEGCTSLQHLDLSAFQTPNVEDMSYMFFGCTSLEALDLSSFDFSSVRLASGMYAYDRSLREVSVGAGYDTSKKGAFPAATASNGMWWSRATRQWFTSEQISSYRNGVGDTYLNAKELVDIVNAEVLDIPDQEYAGVSIVPPISVWYGDTELIRDRDYKVACTDNIDAGSATVTVCGVGDYTGSKALTFNIVPVDLGKASITGIGMQHYTGEAATPDPTIRLGTIVLKKDVDYKLSFTNNTEVGTAGVVITGVGNCVGTRSEYFRITQGLAFCDIALNTAHEEDILWLGDTGISTGWAKGAYTAEFRPYANVARADMAAFMFRLAVRWGIVDNDWQLGTGVGFSDVTQETAHSREIKWLACAGISRGWSDGTFRPYANVARADMAAFLHRLALLANVGSEDTDDSVNSFVDVSDWTVHATDVEWLATNGISLGWNSEQGREFRPYENITRADMAAFLHRLDSCA